jgi:photosystem II stability/assembly factor-like uncharacterized protein
MKPAAAVSALIAILISGCGQSTASSTSSAGPTAPIATLSRPSDVAPVMVGATRFVSFETGWITESRPAMFGPTVLFKTSDGGQHWQRQLKWDGPDGADQMLFEGNEGLVVAPYGSTPPSGGGPGSEQIFRTTDGGSHWHPVPFPAALNPSGGISPLTYFKDPLEGWLVSDLPQSDAAQAACGGPCVHGTPAAVFHTTDGGEHWAQTAQFASNLAVSSCSGSCVSFDLNLQGRIEFRDRSSAFMEASCSTPGPCLWRTSDGGKTWTRARLTAPTLPANEQAWLHELPHFFNDSDGVLLAYAAPNNPIPSSPPPPVVFVYSTSDGGATWSAPHRLPTIGGRDPAFFFLDAGHVWMVSDQTVAVSADLGLNWTLHAGVVPPNVFQITNIPGLPQFITPMDGWTAGTFQPAGQDYPDQSLYRTSDGGLHWIAIHIPSVPLT